MQNSDGYTFILNENVERQSVSYENTYGIKISADLYLPKVLDQSIKHPAIVVGPPHGGVKEQGPGVYANELAARGFVALGFDPNHMGESAGSPRNITNPELFAENFSAGVDFLGSLAFVDRKKIGAIGICGSGGFLLNQAQVDRRIAALVTSAMYDISRLNREGFMDSYDKAEREKWLEDMSEQRWRDVDAGNPELFPGFPEEIMSQEEVDNLPLPEIAKEFFTYYATARGKHPRAVGAFTKTSYLRHANWGRLAHPEDISVPVLMITGDKAHSKYFTDSIFEELTNSPKEKIIVEDCRHIDLYDRLDKIPFDTIQAFFENKM
ncbi:MAG: alpha/beta hydrolase [Streptococcaceae bacterium]|jgi:fermentation-respiration switch protein FrsA (DUF1100 family)|nr:alpha/beta hydrolase [Streptococcaceae bacterium]